MLLMMTVLDIVVLLWYHVIRYEGLRLRRLGKIQAQRGTVFDTLGNMCRHVFHITQPACAVPE